MTTATTAPPSPTYDHAARVLLEERVTELWRYRAWWRAHRWADWPDVRREADVELRALVRLLRKARQLDRQTRHELAAGDFYAYATGGER
jgi:hypothetical protein